MGIKLIFLDIDGVLNNESTRARAPNSAVGINMGMVSIFKRIIEETDAKIVLSSAWRLYPKIHDYLWGCLGQDIKERCVGMTPSSWSDYRGREIKQWLESNKNIEIDSFIILDDCNDMEPFSDRLIQTSWQTGITTEHADKAIEMLNK